MDMVGSHMPREDLDDPRRGVLVLDVLGDRRWFADEWAKLRSAWPGEKDCGSRSSA
jgi:hypothetical protein